MSFQRILMWGCCVVLGFGSVHAQTSATWVGNASTGGNISIAQNWLSGIAPATNGTVDVLITGSVTVAPVSDSWATFNSLTIDTGVPSLTIAAGTSSNFTVNSSITQKSANLQTISSPLALGSNFSFLGAGSGLTQLDLINSVAASSGFTVGDNLDLRVRSVFSTGSSAVVNVQSGSVLEITGFPETVNITNNGTVKFGGNTTDLAVGGMISGSGTVSIVGNTTFNANNSYSGNTSLGASTLTIGTANALPTGTVVVFGNATSVLNLNNHDVEVGAISDATLGTGSSIALGSGNLTIDGAQATSTYSGVISGSGSLIKNTSGTLTLGGLNNYTGNTVITGGTLQLGATGALPSGTPVLLMPNLLSMATLDLNGNNQTIGALRIGAIGTSSVHFNGGTLSLGGDVTYDGSNGPPGATLGNPGETGAINVNGDRVFNIGSSTTAEVVSGISSNWDVSIGVTLTGGGNVTKDGLGNLDIDAPANYTGATIIKEGRLRLGGNGSLPTGTDVLVDAQQGDAILDLAQRSATIGNLTFRGAAGSVQVSAIDLASGTLTVDGNVTYDASNGSGGAEIRNGGTVALGRASTTFNVGHSGNAAVDLTIRAPITGSGGLVKTGSGTLVLASPNLYAGVTTISGGTLQIGDNSGGGGLTGDVVDNAALVLNAGWSSLNYAGNITGSGNVTVVGSDIVTLTGNASHTGGTSISPGATLQIGDGTTDGALSGNVANSGQLWFTTVGNVAYNGVISGNGNFAKGGAGTLTLSGLSSYTGETLVCSGTLLLANAGTLNSNSYVKIDSGAVLEVAQNQNQTLTALDPSAGGTIRVDLGATVLLRPTNSLSFSGNITGPGKLSIYAPNQLVSLGGAVSPGTMVIAGGQVFLSQSNALSSSGTVLVRPVASNFAMLGLSGTSQEVGSLTLSSQPVGNVTNPSFASAGVFIGTGGVLKLDGNLTFDASNAPVQGFISGNGTLDLGSADRTFSVGHSNNASIDLTIKSQIAGTVNVTKTGAGALLLGATNSGLLGNLTIAGGALFVGASNAAGVGTLTMQSSTTLSAAGFGNSSSSTVTLSNPVLLNDQVTLGNQSLGGSLTLSGNVSVPSTGTVHVVQKDPIVITGALVGNTSSLTIDGGGTLALAGNTTGVASLTANQAAILIANPAVLTGGSAPTIRATNGYVGIVQMGAGQTPTFAALSSRIDKANFTGSVGFDTPPSGGGTVIPATFADAIDLTGFNGNVAIGSATGAILTGTITPAGADYNFGNGGGMLAVQSNLTGAHGLVVSSLGSSSNATGVVLQGNNTFSGNASVSNGALVLDSATALPSNTKITLGNAYLSATDAFSSGQGLTDLLGHISGNTGNAIIGLDSAANLSEKMTGGYGYSFRVVNEGVDLRPVSAISFGTITNLELRGEVHAPQNGVLSLVSLGDGTLAIDSNITASDASQLSLGSSVFGNSGKGVIVLSGANSYTGGTTLGGGQVLLTRDTTTVQNSSLVAGPLGTGTITVAANANMPVLMGDGVTLNNAVVLNSWLDLQSGGRFSAASTIEHGPTAFIQSLSGSDLTFNGPISGSGGLQIDTSVALNGANTFTGGVNWSSGTLQLGSNTALGTGMFNVNGFGANSSLYLNLTQSTTLTNPISINGGQVTLNVGGTGSLTLTNPISLSAASVEINPEFAPVIFNGSIGGSAALTAGGSSAILVNGTGNSYSGGTAALSGKIIFASVNSIPGAGILQVYDTGYIGLATPLANPSNLQNQYINRFVSYAGGTIGFDTPIGNSTVSDFTGNISLANMSSGVKLGSATSAILDGTITPYDGSYAFGGGGGALTVRSNLVDYSNGESYINRNVEAWSNDSSKVLTLVLSGNNTYSGETRARNSAVVFDSVAASGAGGTLVADSGGYIGLRLSANAAMTDTNVTNFLKRFVTVSPTGYLGFETSGSAVTVTDLDLSIARLANVSLSAATFGNAGIATMAPAGAPLHVAGNLTLPSNAANYRFAGFKGGQLVVDSTLSGSRGIIIGDTSLPATMADINDVIGTITMSSVTLNGANSALTGDTQLEGGNLFVGNGAALGTGTLRVASGISNDDIGLRPGFFTTTALTIPNNIVLNSDLNIGGNSDVTLTGAITGGQELYKTGYGNLTLDPASGQNGFGSIYIQGGNVIFNSSAAVGQSIIEFGRSLNVAATFLDNSTVNGIAADSSTDVINLTAGKTFTVLQSFDTDFKGTIAGTTAGLVIDGGHFVKLSGASTFAGPVTIQGNSLVRAANNNAFGLSTNTVSVNNAKLAIGSGITVANPVTLTNAILGGAGTLNNGALGLNFSNGNVLAPGIGGAGTLTLMSTSAIILGANGGYGWDLLDASNATSGWDRVVVNGNVNITASATAKFNFKLTTIAPDGSNGFATSFDPTHAYTWTVLSATSLTGFTDTNQFAIDTTGFLNQTNGGTFSMSATSTSLVLNFTPIPEPSTYALMLSGLGLSGIAYLRRRRR